MLDLIAFSKDRPAQLDLLLRSMDRFVEDADRGTVGVVFTASEPAYDDGYALVRAMYPGVRWIDEREARGSFKELTLGLLGAHPYTAFIVDDNVFRAPFSFCGPELRRLAVDR
jgi:hypothetical protein